jgi:hypothetical protein
MTGFLSFFATHDTTQREGCRHAVAGLMAMDRIDLHPTEEYEGYKLRPGQAVPFGATFVPGGVNFSVFSRHAIACTLVLFEKGASSRKSRSRFPMPIASATSTR